MTSRNSAPTMGALRTGPRALTLRGISDLTKIKVDQTLSSVLTTTSGVIRVSIDQDNANVGLYGEDNKRFGAIAEIERLGGFRKFVSDARKESIVEELIGPIQEFTYHTARMTPDEEPAVIQPGGLNLLKEVRIQSDFLKENFEYVQETLRRLARGDDAAPLCDILIDWINNILAVERELIRRVVFGSETKGFISDELLRRGIPRWAFDKLAKMELASTGTTDVKIVFFPRDIRKGLVMTPRELCTEAFVKAANNRFLLRNSQYQMQVLRNQILLKEICKVKEEISFTSESDTTGLALRGEKIIITPIFFAEEAFFDEKAPRLALNANPSFATAKQGLATIMNAGLAYQTGTIRTADVIADYWGRLFPNIDFLSDASKKKGPRATIKATGPGVIFERLLKFDDTCNAHFLALLPALLGLATDHKLVEMIKAGLESEQFEAEGQGVIALAAVPETKDAQGRTIVAARPAIAARDGYSIPTTRNTDDFSDAWPFIDMAIETREDRDRAQVLWEMMKIDHASLKRTAKKSRAAHFSDLSKPGKDLVKQVKDNPRLAFLAIPITDWLCGFSSKRIQVVGARFIQAQFEELTGLEDDDDDDDGDQGDPPYEDNY